MGIIEEEEFVRKIAEAFNVGDKIARRLAHSMLIGPPGSGKSSLMDRLLLRKTGRFVRKTSFWALFKKKFTISTDISEGVISVEVKLAEKPSTFHAADVVDGKWEEFQFSDSLFSQMSLNEVSDVPFSKAKTAKTVPFSTSGDIASSMTTKKVRPKHPAAGSTGLSSSPEASTSSVTTKKVGLEQVKGSVQILRLDPSVISYLQRNYSNYKQFKKSLEEKGYSLYLRDTGGQVEFQQILPLLIFGPSIFLFVFRLDLPFQGKFEVKYRQENSVINDYISSITIEEALLQCLATVDVVKKSDRGDIETRDPFVFIIGTHKDELRRKFFMLSSYEKKVRELNLYLDTLLKDHGFRDLVSYAGNDPEHVIYTVDNTSKEETDFDLIRSRINAVVTGRDEFVIEYPINYLLFCMDLQNEREQIIFLQDFKKRAERFGIVGDWEVSKLLHFLCDRIGVIQHFDKKGVDHIIVNQPQFLYKEVSNLIIETFKGRSLNAAEQVELEKGILSYKAAESIITSGGKISTTELFDLLVHLRIVARLGSDKFFIPYVLNHLPEAGDDDLKPEDSMVAPLSIRFGCKYCPKGLFGVLITYLMSPKEACMSSPSLRFMEDGISKDKVSFEVKSGESRLGFLSLKATTYSIEVALLPVIRSSAQDGGSSLIAGTCYMIRQLVESYLSNSFKDLHYDERLVRYELCLKCERCSEYHAVINESELCCKLVIDPLPPKGKYWFNGKH